MNPSFQDMAILFSLFGTIFLLGLCTFVCAILCLILKDKKRKIAIDTLLWLATSVIAVTSLSVFLPKSITQGKSSESLKISYQKKVDLVGIDMIGMYYSSNLKSPWKDISLFLGERDLKSQQKEEEKTLSDLLNKHKDDRVLAAKLAIVMHENGSPINPDLLRDKTPSADQSMDKNLSKNSDTKNSGDKNTDDKNTDDKNTDDKNTAENAADASLNKASAELKSETDDEETEPPSISIQEVLKELYFSKPDNPIVCTRSDIVQALPSGWYRNAVLRTFYERTNNKDSLNALNEVRTQKMNEWQAKYIAFLVGDSSLVVIGLLSIVLFFRQKPGENETPPTNYGFRQAYGCMLSNYYFQNIVGICFGFCIGLMVGIQSAINHTKAAFPNTSALMTPVVIVAGAFATALTFYLFVCRPLKLSLKDALISPSRISGITKQAMYSCLGFSAVLCLATIVRLVFLRTTSGSPTESMMQLIDSFVTSNILGLMWSGFWFCVLAPFTEELLMRVLLYPWLRARVGMVLAIILSSSVFAIIHFNFAMFLHYFVIGAVLAFTYERTKSFPIIVGIHGLWNAWVVLYVASLLPN